MSYTLKYFGIPALGEPIRMLLKIGEIPFTDERLTFETWPAVKPSTKWGQVPVLYTPEGKEMTQSKAITIYLAKLVKVDGKSLYPEDPIKAFDADEMINAFEDVRQKLVPTFRIEDKAEKEAARARLFAEDGDCTALLRKIETFAGDKYICGDSMTVADIWAAFFLNFLRCGFWEGLPGDYLDKYPKLSAISKNVLSLPQLKDYYRTLAGEHPMYKAFAV